MNRVLAGASVLCKSSAARGLTSSKAKSTIAALKEKQRHFQIDDGVPVYLKGGTKDYITFYACVALVFGSLALNAHSLYKLISKK